MLHKWVPAGRAKEGTCLSPGLTEQIPFFFFMQLTVNLFSAVMH